MGKMKMQSEDIILRNVAKIREIFPNCLTETQDKLTGELRSSIDFDQLRQELSDHVIDGPQERYHLDWPGKRESLLLSNWPTSKTLRPRREESVEFDLTRNLFIEGDNLEALKLIEKSFFKAVKMIYIDPPYNTGRNLIYKNDFKEQKDDFLAKSRQVDDSGNRLVSNPESSGRFHSDWLSMMYQRLRVAKNVLADDGALVCAIDENEFGSLSLILKEIFSGSSWEHTYVSVVHNPRGQQGKNFSYTNEYLIFVYPSGKKIIADREISDEDVKWSQLRTWGGESLRSDAKNCFYPVIVEDGRITGFGDVCPDDYHPNQTEWVDGIAHVYPIDGNGVERKWRYARHSVEGIATMLRADRTEDGYKIMLGKTFGLHRTVWTDKRYDSNEYGTKLVNELVEGSGFTYPKSLWAVYDSIKAITSEDKDAIVLDFFAGSGTTAHAVMQLNLDDGGKRRFICVQIPEQIDSDTASIKAEFSTIADISKERIRRAGREILDEAKDRGASSRQDVGFRVLKVDSSNMKDVFYRPDELEQKNLDGTIDNVKTDRTAEDLLFQVFIQWGMDLSAPVESKTVDDKQIFAVEGGGACSLRALTEAYRRTACGNWRAGSRSMPSFGTVATSQMQ